MRADNKRPLDDLDGLDGNPETRHIAANPTGEPANSRIFSNLFPIASDSVTSNAYGNYEILQNPTPKMIAKLPLIQTLDIAATVDSAMAIQGMSKKGASLQQILSYAKAAINNEEIPSIVTQLALLEVILSSNKPPTEVAETIKASSTDKLYNSYLDTILDYLSQQTIDPKTKLPINASGLITKPHKTFCPMPQDKHIVMRALDQMKTTFAGREVTGKPYADYLDPKTTAGKTVFPPSENQALVNDERYAQIFYNDLNLLFHVCMAIERDALQNYQQVMRDNPHLLNTNLEPTIFSKIKPNLVVTATPEESDSYTAKCTFPNGKWHIELPDIVLEQLEFSESHDLNDPEKSQRFIFVEELGTGNIKLATHLDTTFHHSTALGGAPVATAGELMGKIVKNDQGKYCLVVDEYIGKSGHYLPALSSMAEFRNTLIHSGLDSTQIKFTAVTRNNEIINLVKQWGQDSELSLLPQRLEDGRYTEEINKAILEFKTILCDEPPRKKMRTSQSTPNFPSSI